MNRILDCHIHAYPPEVCADARAWGEAHAEPWFVSCVAPPGKAGIQGWATIDQLLRDMDQAGVEQVVMLGWYWERQETCEWQNQWFLDWHRQHPDRIQAFATVRPASGQRGLDDVRRALDGGLRGIGELFPQVQGFTLRDACFAELVALSVEAGVPFNLHVTDPTLPAGPGVMPTPLADYVQLARDFPAATFILAHWGGGLPFHELMPRVRRHMANIYYDTSASPLLYDKAIFRRVIDLVGADRILFGSDYPLMLYPRESREPGFARFLADVTQAGLTDGELAGVLGGNARKLLRLA